MGEPSSRTEVFEDDRGRALRVTWHPESSLVTVSIWTEERCVASVRLHADDAARLSSLLVDCCLAPAQPGRG